MRADETIRHDQDGPAKSADDFALALHALVWILSDDMRASRLIALTGLDPADLRARANDPAVLGAALAFLQSHQPDLLACADALGVAPETLVAAGERLSA